MSGFMKTAARRFSATSVRSKTASGCDQHVLGSLSSLVAGELTHAQGLPCHIKTCLC